MMIKKIFLLLLFVLNLFAIEKDIKSNDFNLAIIKYILSNSIHKNLDINSVDRWYLNNTNKDLYDKVKSDNIKLNEQLSKNYMNYQKDIIKISNDLKNNDFYFEKLLRFSDNKNLFKIEDLIQNSSYFIVDSYLKNSYESVGRFYIKNIDMKKDSISISKKVDVAYVRYIFDIIDLRLNSLKDGFKSDINSLNLDIDIFISIKDIKLYDINKNEIK